MNATELKNYLANKMKMSHIYQPVMIKLLLNSKGVVGPERIAREFLKHDLSQIEYYQQIVKNMPAKILLKHHVIKKESSGYKLEIAGSLSTEEVEKLSRICDKKIDEYMEKRGMKIWGHRRIGYRAISGSVRYEVLKRAGFHCELCGVKAGERSIEVDHIVPKNRGGSNEIENYQALCYKCNANKRDTDSTDFRRWKEAYSKREANCVFCAPPKSRLLTKTSLAYILRDKYPVTEGHVLVIPKRHVESVFELFDSEYKACIRLLKEWQQKVIKNNPSINGFNIGINDGEPAGQTVNHCHWHLIPRKTGDVPNPKGGIRHCVMGKGYY